ncbi:galactose/methyl galactoside ABC transport system ATP-binding protein MglA [Vibrio variabilis]|uniref:Ribose/galactose/methyl galactoside import ATP-binding protein n=1 Tax=Vibrio variabilis TaxID=990271 RepID=A0ABQ0JQP5_9VIBR|nr:galactose/methyl galactoside ABC transport system ATP-binding protein MglA [Vibrio variabilis]
MVHQELNQVLQCTVMDNIWLGRYPKKGLFVDHDKMYRDTKEIFKELDIDIDPRVKVNTLSVSQMQMLEIAKAFSYDANRHHGRTDVVTDRKRLITFSQSSKAKG